MSLFTAFVSFFFFFSTSTAVNACSSETQAYPHCPPFGASLLPFPFSSSPGCGHPSFQINCSGNHSTISINDASFTVVRYDPNSTALALSPTNVAGKNDDSCPNSPPIPRRPINLTDSPFRVADSFCSRLSSLRPCPDSPLPNCSLCPWECRLAKNPTRVLAPDCPAARRRGSGEPCRGDVLEYLGGLLRFGVVVEWDQSGGGGDEYFRECRDCKAKSGVCGFDTSDPGKRFVCFRSRSRLSPPWIGGDDPKRIAVLAAAFSLACLLLVSLVGAAVFRSRMFVRSSDFESEDPTATVLHRHGGLPPEIAYEELEASTNGFDPKRKIGDGGFGSVYLGRLGDGRFVAVKYLHRQRRRQGRAFSSKSFCNEILILSSIHHPNLVRLHGYCSDPRGLVLVYDYVPNGTLAAHLHGGKRSPPLPWPVRVDVALQIAAAMEYLHFAVAPPVVHRDITSSNVFVEKDMRVKVGDFGLSRLLVLDPDPDPAAQTGCVWTGPQGTPGYLDPDYHRSFRLTEKSDVYSFGVVLLELITGMRAVDRSRGRTDISLADLVVSKIHAGLLHQVVDPALMDGSGAADGVDAAAELAFRCVAPDKDDRPDAREVVRELRIIRSRTRGKEGGGDSVDGVVV